MDVAPEIMERTAQPYAGISAWLTMAAVGSVADRIPEIFGWLGAHGVAPAGPPFFRYHVIDMDRELLVEAGVPVGQEGVIQPQIGDPRRCIGRTIAGA